MGGFGSGRRGGYGVTEDGLTLDMSQCVKLRQFRPGSSTHGKITWRNSRTREVVATLGYTADMIDPENAWVRLIYSSTHLGETSKQDYRVELTTTSPNFGGLRWWFRCPVSHRRVRCLHLAGHSVLFASRRYLRLGYQCQRETWADRRLRAGRVVDTRLGGDGSMIDDDPPKPKWMRWPTYRRLVQARERAAYGSALGEMAALDMPCVRELISEAAREDPGLLAGSGLV